MTRQEIYEQVWASPLTKVAARMQVAPGTLRNACRAAEVPVPGRGHWAKASIGTAPMPPRLLGSKGEQVILRKSELVMRPGKPTPGEPSCPAQPAECTTLRGERDQIDAQLQRLEAASQVWAREQRLQAFLTHVLAHTPELPTAQAAQLHATLSRLLQILRGGHAVRDAIAELVENSQ